MAALRELLAAFRIDVDVKRLEEANKRIDEASKKFIELGELLVGGVVAEGFKEFVEKGVEAGAQLKIMSERLGLSMDELQKFQFAAGQSGASAEEANNSLRLLNRTIGEAASGNAEAAKNFSDLKIAIKDAHGEIRPTTEIVADIADAMSKTDSQAKKTKIALDFFGRGGAALIPTLSEGREGIEKLYSAFEELGGGMDEAFVEQAHRVEQAQGKLNLAILSMKTRVLAIVLPYVERMTAFVTKLWVSLKKLTDGTNILKTGLIALGVAFAAFTVSKVWALVGGFEGLAAAFQEILLPLAAFALAYLVFDDFYTLLSGGDSLIGRFIDRMWGVGASAEAVAMLKAAWDGVWSAISKSSEEGGVLNGVFDVLESALEGMVDVAEGLLDTLIGIVKYLLAIPKGLGAMAQATQDLLDNVGRDFEDLGADLGGEHRTSKQVKQTIKEITAPKLPTEPDTAISFKPIHRPGGPAQQTNHVTVNVMGGNGSPQATGEAAKKGTLDALSDPKLRGANAAVSTGM